MKTTKVKCAYFGKRFNRAAKEVTRSLKLGRPSFCCRAHAVAAGNSVTPRGNWLPPHARRDEFTQFRFFLSYGHGSMRKYGGTLTLADVKAQWISQAGKCAYTGLPMVLPDSVGGWKVGATPFAASLDRKDSSKGYTPDNIEFVCRFVNYGKNNFTAAQTRDFIDRIRQEQPFLDELTELIKKRRPGVVEFYASKERIVRFVKD